MGRDWTPREWDKHPVCRFMIDGVAWIDDDGNKYPAISDKKRKAYEMFPHLKLVGLGIIQLCEENGILDTEKGLAAIGCVEDIINGKKENSDFAEKVRLWYDGKLCPGYYLDDNDKALFHLIEEMAK